MALPERRNLLTGEVLTRYVDDFVVMCRAESAAKEALRRIGLVMNRWV
jgi:hypothetical protein